MLVVPLGLIGAVMAVAIAGMTNDVFFKVGMITLIGLSAKNAILIVEFARQLHRQGSPCWRQPFMPPASACGPF
jgi:multidrug efflux pump